MSVVDFVKGVTKPFRTIGFLVSEDKIEKKEHFYTGVVAGTALMASLASMDYRYALWPTCLFTSTEMFMYSIAKKYEERKRKRARQEYAQRYMDSLDLKILKTYWDAAAYMDEAKKEDALSRVKERRGNVVAVDFSKKAVNE